MLTKLYVDNFRCLVNFELSLKRCALLLGPNGSGKSTVFEVLFRLRQFVLGEAKVDRLFPASDLTRWQKLDCQHFQLEMEGNGGKYGYELIVKQNLDKQPLIQGQDRQLQRVEKETLSFDGKPLFEFLTGEAQLYHDDHKKGPKYPFDWSQSGLSVLQARPDNKKLTWFKDQLSRLLIVGVQPPVMISDSGREERIPSRTMDNFSSWYRHLSQEHRGHDLELHQELRKILPGFDSFNLPDSGENHKTLQVGFKDAADNRREVIYFKFDELSDGQRGMIVLYTMLHGLKNLGYSLFLDEPENYLALAEIQPWLMSLSDLCGKEFTQATLISHHPEVIDYLGLNCGIWFERTANGHSRVMEQSSMASSGLRLSENIARGWNFGQ